MAEYLTTDEVRNYPLSNGTTADLIAQIGTGTPRGWVYATKDNAPVGTVAYVSAMGADRRGVVVKHTPTKIQVAITTQGALQDDFGRGVRVQVVSVPTGQASVAPPADDDDDDARLVEKAHTDALAEAVQIQVEADHTLAIAEDYERHLERLAQADRARALTLHSQAGKVALMNNESNATETAPAADNTGSAVVRLLEKVWTRIREDHPELPEIVIITGSGLVGASKWGHFRANGWKIKDGEAMHEMFMAGETLAKGSAQVLQTMLHEGAHTLAKVREISDTSRQGRWHNKEFKTLAAVMGLEHKASQADSALGYSFVTLTEDTKARYADLLAELDAEIRLMCHLPGWMGGTGDDEENGGEKITGKPTKTDGGETKTTKAVCECDTPNIIRLSDAVLELGVVECRDCESLFAREV